MLLFNDSHLKLTCSSVTEPFQVAQSNRTKVAPKESGTNGDSSLLWSHCLYFSEKKLTFSIETSLFEHLYAYQSYVHITFTYIYISLGNV